MENGPHERQSHGKQPTRTSIPRNAYRAGRIASFHGLSVRASAARQRGTAYARMPFPDVKGRDCGGAFGACHGDVDEATLGLFDLSNVVLHPRTTQLSACAVGTTSRKSSRLDNLRRREIAIAANHEFDNRQLYLRELTYAFLPESIANFCELSRTFANLSRTPGRFPEPFPNFSRTPGRFPALFTRTSRHVMRGKGSVAVEGELGSKGDLLVGDPHTRLVTELANLAYARTGGLDVTREGHPDTGLALLCA